MKADPLRRRFVAVASLLATLFFAGSTPAKEATWHEARSRHFRVFSDAGKLETEAVARQLETILDAYGQIFFAGSEADLALDARVYAFREADGMNRFRPKGFRAKVAGWYGRPLDRLFVSMTLSRLAGRPYEVAQHELGNAFIDHALRENPLWLGEGLAEYLETLEVDGRWVTLGKPDSENIIRIRNARAPMPLSELLAIGPGSPEYREQEKTALYHARAYYLVHWLVHGREGTNTARFEQLLRKLAAGEPGTAALVSVCGADVDALDAEIKASLRQEMRHGRLELREGKDHPVVTRELGEEETQGQLALLAVVSGNDALARKLIGKPRPDRHPAILLAETMMAKDAAATAAAAKAQLASPAPDPIAALLLAGSYPGDDGPRPQAAAPEAVAALRKALELDPSFTFAMNNLAWLLIATPEGLAEGAALAARAVALDPKAAYLDTLAEARLALGDTDGARALWRRAEQAAREHPRLGQVLRKKREELAPDPVPAP